MGSILAGFLLFLQFDFFHHIKNKKRDRHIIAKPFLFIRFGNPSSDGIRSSRKI
jgi:hypothetical protein